VEFLKPSPTWQHYLAVESLKEIKVALASHFTGEISLREMLDTHPIYKDDSLERSQTCLVVEIPTTHILSV
jgi:hypothetical protein